MNEIRIGQQIARLRREKGITQEELAQRMGVSNQSVSKWENGQSCPDIGLLPSLASYFGVTTDALLGCAPDGGDSLPRTVHSALTTLSREDAAVTIRRLAGMLHTVMLAKCSRPAGQETPVWATEQALRHAQEGKWGESGFYLPELTGRMRSGMILFSDNGSYQMSRARYAKTTALLRTMAKPDVLRVFLALYALTAQSETAYATTSETAEKSGVSPETAEAVLSESLAPYLDEGEADGNAVWRINGASMSLPPLLCLLCPIEAE